MERCGILSGDLSRTNPGGEKVVVCVCFPYFFCRIFVGIYWVQWMVYSLVYGDSEIFPPKKGVKIPT